MSGAPFAPRRLALKRATIVLLAVLVGSESGAVSLTDPRVDRLTVADGLPDGTVYAIAQDLNGFLWFGTQYGLARYDGYSFNVYLHDPSDRDSIRSELASSLLVDRRGRLWVGTWGGGLERYDPSFDGFRHFGVGESGGLADSRVQALFEDSRGDLWVGTNEGGLQQLEAETERFRTYGHDPDDPGTLSHERVWDITESADGLLWIATGAGVDRLDPATGTIERDTVCGAGAGTGTSCLPHEQVRALLFDSRGALWVGTREGLTVAHADGRRETFRTRDAGLADDSVNRLFEDGAGRIWVGTVYGGAQVFEVESGTFRTFPDASELGLRGDDVRSIFEDRAGLLWMGTRGDGAIKLDPRSQFRRNRLTVDGDPSGSRVSAIATISERWAWAGGPHGLTRIDRRSGASKTLSRELDGVRALHVDPAGRLWVGTERGHLLRLDAAPDTTGPDDFTTYPNPSFEEQPLRAIANAPGSAAELWIGTANGIFVLDVATGSYRFELRAGRERDEVALPTESVTALVFDGAGRLWIGTQYDGVVRYDLSSGLIERYENVSSDASLPGNNILTLFSDRRGGIWAGTRSAGLARWDEEAASFKSYGLREGLASNTVHAIAEDGEMLWVSTSRGLSRLDPDGGAVRNFGMSDGLQQMSFLDGAVHRADDGELFFGGRQGYVSFRPDEIVDSRFVAPIQITSLRLFGQPMVTERPVWALEAIELGPDDDYLTIEFAALDFTQPSGNRFEYRLDGFDRDWVNAGARRSAQYTNLDGGSYRFRVRGSNHDGVWNEDEATLTIRVVPAWWERTWVRWASALGMLALVALGVRRRLSRARAIQESLEALVHERTKALEVKTEELEASYRVVEELSHTDALTGLRNRRYFDETIEIDVARVVRQYEQNLREGREPPRQHDLLFVVIDLDRFKLVNDTFGHRAGDEVLQQLGKLLRATCRDSDLVVRWGGEEFLIVLKSTDRAHAAKLVEALRRAVESRAFDLIGGKHLDVTCSLGFASFPFDTAAPRRVDVNLLLELADQALYEAKRAGRNTWVGVALGGDGASAELAAEMGGRVSQRLKGAPLAWVKPVAATTRSSSTTSS